MLVGVDGTGDSLVRSSYTDFEYQIANRRSLIMELTHEARGMYFRGPTQSGMDCHHIGVQVANWIIANRGRMSGPLFLAGYSRGGAICIITARLLQAHGMSVDCMLLLDAVNWSPNHAGTIPSNVKIAYHAVRRPEIGSRPLFFNCGMSIEKPGILVTCAFNATHGGIGGTPWSGVERKHFQDHVRQPWMTRERDEKGTNEVKNWSWMMLRKHGATL